MMRLLMLLVLLSWIYISVFCVLNLKLIYKPNRLKEKMSTDIELKHV